MGGYRVALEVNDLAGGDDPESIVAGNIFHRAVAFGPLRATPPLGVVTALVVNGERRAARSWKGTSRPTIGAVDRILEAVGETVRAGDRIITGSIVNGRIAPGDDVVADVGDLGRVALRIA